MWWRLRRLWRERRVRPGHVYRNSGVAFWNSGVAFLVLPGRGELHWTRDDKLVFVPNFFGDVYKVRLASGSQSVVFTDLRYEQISWDEWLYECLVK